MKHCTKDSLRNNSELSLGDLAFPHTSLYVGSSYLQPNTFYIEETASPGFAQSANQERSGLRLWGRISTFQFEHSHFAKQNIQHFGSNPFQHPLFHPVQLPHNPRQKFSILHCPVERTSSEELSLCHTLGYFKLCKKAEIKLTTIYAVFCAKHYTVPCTF